MKDSNTAEERECFDHVDYTQYTVEICRYKYNDALFTMLVKYVNNWFTYHNIEFKHTNIPTTEE